MRIGGNPNIRRQSGYAPARVTVCVLVSIPSQVGYYAHRLEVLRLCLRSIATHTDAPYDLLVFDNGSCAEVVEALRVLQRDGVIHYLLLSARNVGKMAAIGMMAGAAPGDVVAYSDDDVLYSPGWLGAQLRILDTFPGVGLVSGVPVRHQFRYGNRSLPAYLAAHPQVASRTGHFIPDEWERDFFRSVCHGDAVEATFQKVRAAHQDLVLSMDGVEAYATATHFQFIAPRSVVIQALPDRWDGGLVASGEVEFDERIDALGLVRLSTIGRYVRHMGNVISPDLLPVLAELGLDGAVTAWTPPHRGARWLARAVAVVPGVLRRAYNWLYFARQYRPPS